MSPLPPAAILVVDDDPDLREAIAFDLRRRNYEVLCAASGREALEIVKARPLDMVISDVRMPDGDGIELLKELRKHHYETPVLMFVTGFADLSLEEAYQLGADAVFSKPFVRRDFFAAIEAALTPRAQRWAERPGREAAGLRVDLRFPDLNYSLAGHLLTIGRGGIFVALAERVPPEGSAVEFRVSFEHDAPDLSGSGLVRWSRGTASPQRPSGCGIEFSTLDEAARGRILGHIAARQPTAFIPSA
jgi:DNA-binding response OmpR family regulator